MWIYVYICTHSIYISVVYIYIYRNIRIVCIYIIIYIYICCKIQRKQIKIMSQRLMTQYYSILYYSILQYISVYYSTLQYCIPKPGFWQCVFVFAILIVTDCELATEVQRLKHHGLRVWKYGIHMNTPQFCFLLGTYWKHDHSPNRIWCYPTIFRSNRGRRNGFFFSP